MGLSKNRLYRETLKASFAFYEKALWTEFDNGHIFAVQLPNEEHPIFVCIMGAGGDEFGLGLYVGGNAWRDVSAMFAHAGCTDDMREEMQILGMTFEELCNVPPEMRSFLDKAKFSGRRETTVPFFMAKEPGFRARNINRREVELFLYLINGILKAVDMGILTPGYIGEEAETLTLTISGDPLVPEIIASRVDYGEGGSAVTSPAILSLPRSLPDLQKLPRLGNHWLAALPTLPVVVGNDDRTVRGVLVVEADTAFMLQIEPIYNTDCAALSDAFFKTCHKQNEAGESGLPERVTFTSRTLMDAVSPTLSGLGVTCNYEDNIPLFAEVIEDLCETFRRGPAGGYPSYEMDDDDDDGTIPAADDLEGWKAVERRLIRKLIRQSEKRKLANPRSIKQYFGDAEKAYPLMEKYQGISIEQAFLEWLVMDYRPKKSSKTCAEDLLVGELPEAERILLKARMQSHISIFRIVSIKPGESLTLDDILLGGTLEVHDQSLSESLQDSRDCCPVMRVFQAGDFFFPSVGGPLFMGIVARQAVELLQAEGLILTPKGLQQKAHLFGRLWQWLDEQESSRPQLANTDHEPMIFQSASFSIANEKTVRRSLKKRDDVDYEKDTDTFIWFRENDKKQNTIGEVTLLARMNLIGGELIIEVNSAGRLERARAWLEKIPGVKFLATRIRELDEVLDDVPLDDRLNPPETEEMPPEMMAYITDEIRKHSFGWLDESIPLLGGITPREACKTEAGRKEVTKLIRTMPDSVGPSGISISPPRTEMLERLGLQGKAKKKRSRSKSKNSTSKKDMTTEIYQLKITLQGIRPPIWCAGSSSL